MPTEILAQVPESYELPGEAVFPESIGMDGATGDAYVGSLADGALYRLTGASKAQVWGVGGQDGTAQRGPSPTCRPWHGTSRSTRNTTGAG
jgi:hypothetical protein